jgi:hypothetical protein
LPIGKLLVEFVRRNILATWLRLAVW